MRNNRLESLPAALPAPGKGRVRPPAELTPVTPIVGSSPSGHAGLSFTHYRWLLRTQYWKILAIVAVALIATATVSVRLTREYESTATLYVDRGAAKDIVGQDSQSQSANIVNADVDSFLASQIKLLQSDAVVRPLAEKYNLLEREKQIKPSDSREKQVYARNAPIVLKGLRITRAPNTSVIQVTYRSTDRDISTEVANGIAESYIKHIYDIRISSSANLSGFMSRQLDELRAKMEESSARLSALETELNVINPEEKTNILSARLLQVNTEYTKVQADRVRAEAVKNALAGGSLDAALASPYSDDLKATLKRLNEARERFADVQSRFGPNHPEYAPLQAQVKELEKQVDTNRQLIVLQANNEYNRAADQETLLQQDVSDTKGEYDHLNQRSFEYQRAKREADADRTLYEELVRKIREDEINSGFQNNMVRLADPARPAYKPVFPNIPLNMVVAFFMSSLIGLTVVLMGDRLDTTLRNAEQITGGLGARVIGTLPIVKTRGPEGLGLLANRATPGDDSGALAVVDDPPMSRFSEAIRTIRNSILLTDFDIQLRSILMTSAVPSEGKSTVAAHLAVSHAEQRHKTLLIDGDMRRPSAHKLFDVSNAAGLSTVVTGNATWRELLIKPGPDLELYILPAGPVKRQAAELVGQLLPRLLEEASEDFDLVILDAPPLLGFPEPLQMAAAVDGVIVVAKAGQTDRAGVAEVLSTLDGLRANVVGVILNEVRKDNSRSYYYYGDNYGKYYAKRADK